MGWRICISNKLLGDIHAAGLGPRGDPCSGLHLQLHGIAGQTCPMVLWESGKTSCLLRVAGECVLSACVSWASNSGPVPRMNNPFNLWSFQSKVGRRKKICKFLSSLYVSMCPICFVDFASKVIFLLGAGGRFGWFSCCVLDAKPHTVLKALLLGLRDSVQNRNARCLVEKIIGFADSDSVASGALWSPSQHRAWGTGQYTHEALCLSPSRYLTATTNLLAPHQRITA